MIQVFVPTFVSPTLFWIIDTSKSREALEVPLQQNSLEVADPIVGEVRVNINALFKYVAFTVRG